MKTRNLLSILFLATEMVMAVVMAPAMSRAQGFMPEADPKKWEAALKSVPIEGVELGKTKSKSLNLGVKDSLNWVDAENDRQAVCVQTTSKNSPFVIIYADKKSDLVTEVEIMREAPKSTFKCVTSAVVSSQSPKLWLDQKAKDIEARLGHPQLASDKGMKFSFQNKKERLAIDVALKAGVSERVRIAYINLEK